jgi:large subunit ribosomal protein L4
MEAKIYNTKGKTDGKFSLPEGVFDLPWNADLVHQVVTSLMSTARSNIAHTKTRGEVRGGGKKPWKQKGTGRARHGSTRSPIWVGGGVAHGPRNDKNYDRKVNKKMKKKAFLTILSKKYKDGEIVFISDMGFTAPKTKEAKAVIESLASVKDHTGINKKSNALFVALPKKDIAVEKSFRNFGNVEVGEARNLSPLHLLGYKYIAFVNPEESLKSFNA